MGASFQKEKVCVSRHVGASLRNQKEKVQAAIRRAWLYSFSLKRPPIAGGSVIDFLDPHGNNFSKIYLDCSANI